jgi:hypothetical protein
MVLLLRGKLRQAHAAFNRVLGVAGVSAHSTPAERGWIKRLTAKAAKTAKEQRSLTAKAPRRQGKQKLYRQGRGSRQGKEQPHRQGRESAKEGKSFTAKDAKEKKSLTAKAPRRQGKLKLYR